MITFEAPEMLWLILPLVILTIYFLKGDTKTKIPLVRFIVFVLIIIALATPQVLTTHTVTDEEPNIVIISDETESMRLFEEGIGDRLYESLVPHTPTSLFRLTGERTAIGDSIVQHSRGNNQIVLISDGNSNHGKDIEDALEIASNTGTLVHYIKPNLIQNDISVQIKGEKTVLVDNENSFDIVITQAGNDEIRYKLEVYHGDSLIRSGTFDQSNKEKTISVSRTFRELGAHELRVEVTPINFESNSINNKFYKSIYAIPKPQVQFITDDTSSPLAEVILNLYDVSMRKELDNLDKRKALVLNNQHIDTFSESEVQQVEEFVREGGGLIVVGGDQSYNYGGYLNSSFEKILPVISTPEEYDGGRNIIMLLDISLSTFVHTLEDDVVTGEVTVYSNYASSAINIINDERLFNENLGLILFRDKSIPVTDGLVPLRYQSNRDRIVESINEETFETLKTQEVIALLYEQGRYETALDSALLDAKEWLKRESGDSTILIISDGDLASDKDKEQELYQKNLEIAQSMVDEGTNIVFVHIPPHEGAGPGQASDFMTELGLEENYVFTDSAIELGEITGLDYDAPDEDEPIDIDEWQLIEFNPNHFITRNTELAANISGFNAITPKPGADRVVRTETGESILTTWRYGLGRVVALTTDDGYGNGNRWSSELYADENARIISSSINWAIGNPYEEEGAILEASDKWLGTPTILQLTMYNQESVPRLTFNSQEIDMSMIGRNTYQGELSSDINDRSLIGVKHVSGYPIAINYPLEYRDIGINKDVAGHNGRTGLIEDYGGKVYTEEEAKATLLDDTREMSERTVTEPVDYKPYFILAALMLFLADVIMRRLKEVKRLRNQK